MSTTISSAPCSGTLSTPPQPQESTPIHPPLGFVSCIFTDIIDSTAMWEISEPETSAALAIHDSIIRRELHQHGGYEVKTLGDGFFVTFACANSALRFCMASQLALQNAAWPAEIMARQARLDVENESDPKLTFRGLTVRMGIHYGKVYSEVVDPTNGRVDYNGIVGCVASRVHRMGAGGEIAVSDAFICALYSCHTGLVGNMEELRDGDRERILSHIVPSNQFYVRSRGNRVFKGVTRPEHITVISLNRVPCEGCE